MEIGSTSSLLFMDNLLQEREASKEWELMTFLDFDSIRGDDGGGDDCDYDCDISTIILVYYYEASNLSSFYQT